MVRVKTKPTFDRHFKKLPHSIQDKVQMQSEIFSQDPFDPRLKTHKLHGERKEEWAFSVDYSYRITFVFIGENEVLYTDIGTHDELY